MKILGKHTIVDLINCKFEKIDKIHILRKTLIKSAKECGLHIIGTKFHKFEPIGISGIIILSESHITIHTWPEYNFISIDVYTCGEKINPENVCQTIAQKLNAKIRHIKNINRGF